MNFRKTRVLTMILLAVFFSACSTPGPRILSGKKYSDTYEAFLAGDISLDCNVACSGVWGGEKEVRKNLYATENWEALAKKVLRIGMKGDLQYFYLGRSAEGLAKPNLALHYYELAAQAPPETQCVNLGDFFDKYVRCDDLQFPKILLVATLRTKESLAKNGSLPSAMGIGP